MGAPLEYDEDLSGAVVISGADNENSTVKIVLRDQTSTTSKRVLCQIPGHHTVQDLYEKVASERGYPPSSFELTGMDLSVELSEENKDVTIDSLGPHNNARIEVLISRAESHKSSEYDHVFAEAASASWSSPSTSSTSWKTNNSNSTPSYSFYSNSSVSTSLNAKGRFCGLSNQGATCYMNSLLQSLFMTPEFRVGVYKIPLLEDADKQKDSICFQLQNLFAQMQLSDKRAVETKDLTKSFGWDSGEAFQQHDVQELCRVLFDELEERLKGSAEETLIKDLFQGYLESYVRNLPGAALEFESKKREEFMDISLAIKQFGNPIPIGSVEEGLGAFIKAETLEGENQYQLDPDADKGRPEKMMVDAKKGLQITDFPYILTLQLKRFDFDHVTMRRIKISDRVSFPAQLDVEPYLAEVPQFQRRISLGLSSPSMKGQEAGEQDDAGEAGPRFSLGGDEADVRGPMEYDLYSVMVHSGSTFGGHYYAYIKSFEDGKWYKFNDASVTEASWGEVEQTFGGSGSSSSSVGTYPSYSSSASAYMLLYRRRDPSVNKSSVPDDMVPEGLRNWMQRRAAEEERQAEEQRQSLNRLNLTVYCGRWERVLAVDKNKTLSELLRLVQASFAAELSGLPLDSIRLRRYHTTTDVMQEAIGPDDDGSSTLASLALYSCSLAVETRPDPEQPWPLIDTSKAAVKVWLSDNILDADGGGEGVAFSHPYRVMQVPPEGKLIDLKREVMRAVHVDVADMVVARANKLHFSLDVSLLLDNTVTKLRATSYGPLDGERFFVAKIPQDQQDEYRLTTSFGRTAMAKAVEAVTGLVTVVFNRPDCEHPEHAVDVEASGTLADLKDAIGKVVGLTADEFRVYKTSSGIKTELCKVAETLSSLGMNWGGAYPRIVVEKGEPPRQGVHSMKMVLLEDKGAHAAVRELSSMSLEEDMLVADVKKEVARKLLADHKIESGSTDGRPHLRLREPYFGNVCEPRKVLVDDLPLAGGSGQLNNSYFKTLNVQVLGAPERKQHKGEVVVELMRWYPAEFKVGPREELLVGEAETVDDVRGRVAGMSGVAAEQLEIGKSAHWVGSARSELESLHWQGIRPRWEPSTTGPAIEALDLREGELYYYKCTEEVAKELSEEEQKEAAAELREVKKARKSEGAGVKEKGLRIKKKDTPDDASSGVTVSRDSTAYQADQV